MRVEELCAREVRGCRPDASLAEAAGIMWEMDCGIVPVLDAEGRAAGVVTDRDLCMAMATRPRPAAEIRVDEVMSGHVAACRADDDVTTALAVMARNRVRRLPVLDAAGRLAGLLSINDVIVRVGKLSGTQAAAALAPALLRALASVCTHRGEELEGRAARA